MSGHPPLPHSRHMPTHLADSAYGENAGTNTLGRLSLSPGQDTPALAHPLPLLSSPTHKLMIDEMGAECPVSNAEVLLGFFHGEFIHNYIQNLK